VSRYDDLVRALEAEIPGFRIVRKDESRLHRFIHRFLIVVTFGGMREYLTSYQTTIGRTVWVTSDWDDRDPRRRYVTLRHEAVHLRQFRRWTLPGMALLYVLLPLPLGLAWFRARFEMEAYADTIRATAEVFGPEAARDPELRAEIIEEFTGPSYGWMWPFRRSLERWYDLVLAEVESVAAAD
jgi:hypothetical protein